MTDIQPYRTSEMKEAPTHGWILAPKPVKPKRVRPIPPHRCPVPGLLLLVWMWVRGLDRTGNLWRCHKCGKVWKRQAGSPRFAQPWNDMEGYSPEVWEKAGGKVDMCGEY